MNNELGVSRGVRRVKSIDEVVLSLKTQVKDQPKHLKENISTECSKFQSMFEVELDKLGKLEAYMKDSGRL